MDTVITLSGNRPDPETLPEWCAVDVRSIPAVPEWCIETCSDPGDAVIDPFAGFGTTIAAAERLGRAGYGIERDPRRVAFIRERADHPHRVVVGDARDGQDALINADDPEAGAERPVFDLCCTAPPFMLDWMDTDPFEGYDSTGTYDAYLDDATAAFEAVADLLGPAGVAVVEVSNVRFGPGVSTLAWDLADAIDDADGLRFRTEVVIGFENGTDTAETTDRETTAVTGDDQPLDGDEPEAAAGDQPSDSDQPGSAADRTWGPETGRYGYGYDHCYCLVFDRVP